jgi:hypothetical protein
MPPNTVSVTRPGRFGNPFKVGGHYRIGKDRGCMSVIWMQAYEPQHGYTTVETPEQAVAMFRELYESWPGMYAKNLSELRGKDLCCWCPLDAPCHADVLLELANRAEAEEWR